RFQMPWSASLAGDFLQRQAYVAAHGVFTLADYYHDVVQFLWSYWGTNRSAPGHGAPREALVQLRRNRPPLRKPAATGSTGSGAAVPGGPCASGRAAAPRGAPRGWSPRAARTPSPPPGPPPLTEARWFRCARRARLAAEALTSTWR